MPQDWTLGHILNQAEEGADALSRESDRVGGGGIGEGVVGAVDQVENAGELVRVWTCRALVPPQVLV